MIGDWALMKSSDPYPRRKKKHRLIVDGNSREDPADRN